jgi:hypothetical protein
MPYWRLRPHRAQRLHVLLDEFLDMHGDERAKPRIGGMLAAYDFTNDQALAGGGRHLDERGATVGAPMGFDRRDRGGLVKT